MLRTALFLFAASYLPAASVTSWTLLRSSHFDLYAQAAQQPSARAALEWLEQIHSFLSVHTGLDLTRQERIRVIAFHSTQEYAPYRLASAADAYFVSAPGGTYIVLSGVGQDRFPVLAHEYAHLALHASQIELPSWLNEGIAEVFSTLHVTQHGISVGGPIPAHLQTLRTRPWMTADQLLSTSKDSFRNDRAIATQFYAHAWALTELLMFSPEYAPRLHDFINAVAAGTPDRKALVDVFGKDLLSIDREIRARAGVGVYGPLSVLPPLSVKVDVGPVQSLSPFSFRMLLAGLLTNTGEFKRAAVEYRELALLQPQNPDVAAALGIVALRDHDLETATREWERAIAGGISDPDLCFEYATLADSVNLPKESIRSALDRAITLKPDFDDARWQLALLESNAGHFEQSVNQLKAMKVIPPSRAFAYWSALSYSQDEIGQHGSAAQTAKLAETFASSDAERARARDLAYIAQTELAVRFATAADGHREMVTSRVPRGASDWNPFIEPSDHMLTIAGSLSEVQCGNGRLTGIVITSGTQATQLRVTDPQEVTVTNGPSQFMCGSQPEAKAVTVDYAAQPGSSIPGVVRGIKFK